MNDLPELNSAESRLEFAKAALEEILVRLHGGDPGSALSIAKGCLIGLRHGSNSSELGAFVAIENARFCSMEDGEKDA